MGNKAKNQHRDGGICNQLRRKPQPEQQQPPPPVQTQIPQQQQQYIPTTQTPGPHRQASVQSNFFNPHSPQQYTPGQPQQQMYQQQQPPQQPMYQQQQQQQQPGYSTANGAGIVRGPSVNGYYGVPPNVAQQPPQNMAPPPVNGHVQQQQQQMYNQNVGYRAPSPAMQRAVSPAQGGMGQGGMMMGQGGMGQQGMLGQGGGMGQAPTGQHTDDGLPVLFYVKALYDYQATIDEEFDFQAGDVIAVTSTPDDGWWTGELLDDSRRIPGRTIFPSNFVCLF